MKINYLKLLPLLTVISCVPLFALSCNDERQQYDNVIDKDEIIPPIQNEEEDKEDESINENDFNFKIQWINGFKTEKTIYFNEEENFVFKLGEIIFVDKNYEIQYVGFNNKHHFSLYNEDIEKYYLCSIDANFIKLSKIWTISKLKSKIYEMAKESYENEMIINHNISDEKFFIPVDTSDKSLSFVKNDILTFESSWGVWNNQYGNSVFDIEINIEKIKEILFGPNYESNDNFKIKNVHATDLYILPKLVLIDTPINYFDFNIDNIKNILNENNLELSFDEKSNIKIDIPGKNNDYSNWSGIINDKNYSGTIINNDFIGGISSSMKNIMNPKILDYGDITAKIKVQNQLSFKTYINEILSKGKKVSINIKNDLLHENPIIYLNINSSIKTGANSSNLIADGSQIGIYDVSCIQKMKINFIEYKKF